MIILSSMIDRLKQQSPARLISLGFALVILLGALLLKLPISIRPGAEVTFVDALFTSTSAVCVTGLSAIDVYSNRRTRGNLRWCMNYLSYRTPA